MDYPCSNTHIRQHPPDEVLFIHYSQVDDSSKMSEFPSVNLIEARRLGDLGYYKDAAKFYAAAEAEHSPPQLSLILEVCGFNLEQGLVGMALDRLNSTTDLIDRTKEEPLQLATFDLLSAYVGALSSVRFTRPLEKAIGVFNEQLLGKSIEEYEKRRV